jgi:cytochrome P450 family 142 subfamily A polypeptide 1
VLAVATQITRYGPGVNDDVRLLDGDFYAGDALTSYRRLRETSPVFKDESSGFWGLASYEAVAFASRRPDLFSSAGGSRPLTGALPHMIDMDDPQHHERRSLVSKGFTPRRIAALEPAVRTIVTELLEAFEGGDFVAEVAAQIPLYVICDLLGIAKEDRAQLLVWSEDMLAGQGDRSEETLQRTYAAIGGYRAYAKALVTDRRASPQDDLVSVLAGAGLSDDDVVSETLLVLIGGDETTRHVIAGGLEALLRHELPLTADPTTVEEMIRWVSPIKNMNRTLTEDVELEGVVIPRGDQALLLYESANRDEKQFADPDVFDPTRSPNEHVAFGLGRHFCMGAYLARLETRVLLEELQRIHPAVALASDERLPRRPNAFISGLERLPLTV